MDNTVNSNYSFSFCLAIYLNADANIVGVNKGSIKDINFQFTSILGLNLFDFFVFSDGSNKDIFDKKLTLFETWHSRVNFTDDDGKSHNVYITFLPSRDSNGVTSCTAVCNIIIPNNIEDLENEVFGLQNELVSNYAFISDYRALIGNSVAVVRIYNGNIIYANKKCESMFGYSSQEILGKSIFFVVDNTAKMHKITNMMWYRLMHVGYAKSQLICLHKNGSKVYVQAYFEVIKSVNNKIEIVGILNDVTEIHDAHRELENIQKDVIFAMGAISEGRSRETGNHVKRVAEYSYLLAKLYGLDDDRANLLKIASPMHDIGKIAIPDYILHKKDKLTEDEFEIMKTHAMKGYEMLSFSNRDVIQTAAQISLTHHEWWNGNGYPSGISSYDIPLFGRITAVADVFDALSNDRCYKKAWPMNQVLDYIVDNKGKQFEPYLVDLFVNNLDSFLHVKSLFYDEII